VEVLLCFSCGILVLLCFSAGENQHRVGIRVVLHRGVASDELVGAANGIRRTSSVGEGYSAYLRSQYWTRAADIDWSKGDDRNRHAVGRGGLLLEQSWELLKVATTVIRGITGTRIAFNLLEGKREQRVSSVLAAAVAAATTGLLNQSFLGLQW